MTDRTDDQNELIHLTIDVVTAFVGQNNMRPEDVPALIASVHKSISALQSPLVVPAGEAPVEETAPEHVPAVTVRKSLASRDHIISMIDGKPYKTLKRHLSTNGLTPAEYRERYNLKSDYPMTAPSYSEARKAMAHKIGLGAIGRNARTKAEAPAKTPAKRAGKPAAKAPAKAPARRGPKPKAVVAAAE